MKRASGGYQGYGRRMSRGQRMHVLRYNRNKRYGRRNLHGKRRNTSYRFKRNR